jgi:hypothetical protein
LVENDIISIGHEWMWLKKKIVYSWKFNPIIDDDVSDYISFNIDTRYSLKFKKDFESRNSKQKEHTATNTPNRCSTPHNYF